MGNPKSVYDDQGFYLYRNRRLISWGSWLRMGVKSELNKLARIQVDIPSSLDAEWTLDVKKSAAKIPDSIKEELIASVKDSVIRSKRTVNFKGKKEQSVINKVWVRKELHTVFEKFGEKYFQIDTYGRSDRVETEKASQIIQFDEVSAKELIKLLRTEFNII